MCYRLLLRTYPRSGVKHTRPAPLLMLTIVLTPLGVAQIHVIASPIGPAELVLRN